MDDHIVFFLGSGVSRPSGMPSVADITQKVLDAPLVYTENKRYVFPESVENNPKIGRPRDSSHRRVAKLRGYLDLVKQHAEPVLSQFGREVTYEDLYALCGVVVNDQEQRKGAHQPVNPEARQFSEKLEDEIGGDLLKCQEDPRDPLAFTANEATFLISGVVREMLSDSPDEIQGLDPLLAAIEELDRVTIVTLNHDLLLEQLLKEHDIDFDDGFEEREDGDVRRYSPERLFDGPNDVTIIKPHGSVSWYVNDSGDQSEYISFPVDEPVPDPTKLPRLLPREPRILHGYRKAEQYTADIYGDMVDALLLALHDTSTVVESGFGWTDPGMYNHLHRYLQWGQDNRLLSLHPEGDFSEPHPRSYYWNSFSNPPQGLLWEELQAYLSGTSWNEIKTEIE